MIELSNISKIFDTGFNQVNALSDIDVKIDQGEFVAIKGPSGSGKTTTLMMLAGFETPTNGEIFLENNEPTESRSGQLLRGPLGRGR